MNPALVIALGVAGFALLFYSTVPQRAEGMETDLLLQSRIALRQARLPDDGLTFSGRDAILTGLRGTAQVSEQARRTVARVHGVRLVRLRVLEPGSYPSRARPAALTGMSAPTLQAVLDGYAGQGITFEEGSTRLTEKGQGILDDVAESLAGNSGHFVEIRAHGVIGATQADRDLCRRRAATVRIYLISKGVPAQRLTAVTDVRSGELAPKERAGRQPIGFWVSGSR